MGFLWKIAESMAFPVGSKASGGYVAVGLAGLGFFAGSKQCGLLGGLGSD